MKTPFYYLGLEARTRSDNKFLNLEEAFKTASVASRRLNVPIRVFQMCDNLKSKLELVVRPDDRFEDYDFKRDVTYV